MIGVNYREGFYKPSPFLAVVDTETTGQGKNLQVYDLSFVVYDTLEQRIIHKSANLAQEVFANQELMSTAYYSDKIGLYKEYLRSGLYSLKPFDEILKEFRIYLEEFEIIEIWAHNASFDKMAIKNTSEKLSSRSGSYRLPFGASWYCSLKLAKRELAENEQYKDFCKKYGFLTKSGKVQLTAETVYRYLKNEPEFVEEHTGLKDAQIELEIIRSLRTSESKATPLKDPFRGDYIV